MRWLALFLLFSTPALAQFTPCPTTTIGWALQYPPPITAVLYDQGSQLLYVIWNNTTPNAYSNVPTSVMQAFSASKNPVQTYNTYVVPSYHPMLLAEKNNCPIFFETGVYFWTAPNPSPFGPTPPPVITDDLLLADGKDFLLLANGAGMLCLSKGC